MLNGKRARCQGTGHPEAMLQVGGDVNELGSLGVPPGPSA